MYHVFLYLLFLPCWSSAPPKVVGLGSYLIGVTTPMTLDKSAFREEDQVFVKGTLTLACPHIRVFKASTVEVADSRVNNLLLAFYDNQLFAISCDYSPALRNAFIAKHGKGSLLSKISLAPCVNRQDQPLLIEGENWTNGDIQAVTVEVKGYTPDCRQEKGVWLMIVSQRVVALSSDCDLGYKQAFYNHLVDSQRPGVERTHKPE